MSKTAPAVLGNQSRDPIKDLAILLLSLLATIHQLLWFIMPGARTIICTSQDNASILIRLDAARPSHMTKYLNLMKCVLIVDVSGVIHAARARVLGFPS